MPDISTVNWNMGDDFSNLNYSFNNWEKNIPSAITFGVNSSYQYGYLKARYTSSSVYGEVIPTQSSDVIGIRADMRLTSLSTGSSHASYYGLGFDLNSYSHLTGDLKHIP